MQGARTSPLRLILHFSTVENSLTGPPSVGFSNHSFPGKAQGHANLCMFASDYLIALLLGVSAK